MNKIKSRIAAKHYLNAVSNNSGLANWLLSLYQNYPNLPPALKRARALVFKNYIISHLISVNEKVKNGSDELWLSRINDIFKLMRNDVTFLNCIKKAAGLVATLEATNLTQTNTNNPSSGILVQLIKRRDSGQLNENQIKQLDDKLAKCNTDQLLQLMDKLD